MKAALRAIRKQIADYSTEFGVSPRAQLADALLGMAAAAVVLIDLALILVAGGRR